MSKKRDKDKAKFVREGEASIEAQNRALGFSPYLRDKGMGYAPSPRDQNRKARKQAKREIDEA